MEVKEMRNKIIKEIEKVIEDINDIKTLNFIYSYLQKVLKKKRA